MFLKNLLNMFAVTLLLLTSFASPCGLASSSTYCSQDSSHIYIPSYVLKKDNISGLEIKEVTSSSPSMGYFIFYQIYKPESFSNPFNGTSSTNSI